jgi:hypothetical protein
MLAAALSTTAIPLAGTGLESLIGEESSTHAATSEPICFIENRGQWADSLIAKARVGHSQIWLTANGIYLQLRSAVESEPAERESTKIVTDRFGRPTLPRQTENVRQTLIAATFVGSQRPVEIEGVRPVGHRTNYFLGDDPERWVCDVPTYETVV